MVPHPLHAAVVHFPIVFSVLLPFFAFAALWVIRRGANPRRAWGAFVALSLALTLSGFVALETGQDQEEAVEPFVAEQPLHQHEEAAERFLVLSGILTVVAAAGLATGTLGRAARVVAAVGSLVVLGAGYQVGDAGGRLVYRYGAAQAYVEAASPPTGGGVSEGRRGERERGELGKEQRGGERAQR